jgi:hypothetical protein
MERIYFQQLDEESDIEDPTEEDDRVHEREHMLALYSGDYPELKLRYEDWERKSSSVQKRLKHGTEVARFAKTEVCHLLWVSVVVEGVLLTTLWQAQLLTCESWWICFYLSFLASLVLFIPLVQRLTTFWSVHARIGSLTLAQQVLSKRIHLMKTMGPLKCTFDEKADDVMIHEAVVKKPGVSSTILRMAVISTTILAVVLFLMLGIQVHCERSPHRLQTFLKMLSPLH